MGQADRAGELRLALIALDQALSAARRMEGGSHGIDPETGAGAARDAAAFEELRERVRGIRNLITHFDDRLAMGYTAVVKVTAEGLTARQRGITFALAFVEWDHWLGQLENRANRVLEEPRGEPASG